MQTQLDKAFSELNQLMLDRQTAWVIERRKALKEKIQELSGSRRGMEYSTYYDAVYSAAGGKTWYNIINGRNEEMIREIVKKNVASLIQKRDAKIISALTKKGITELPEFDLTHTSDGYVGTFYVVGHQVTIQIILAGGYNVQCLHQRTLVKVK